MFLLSKPRPQAACTAAGSHVLPQAAVHCCRQSCSAAGTPALLQAVMSAPVLLKVLHQLPHRLQQVGAALVLVAAIPNLRGWQFGRHAPMQRVSLGAGAPAVHFMLRCSPAAYPCMHAVTHACMRGAAPHAHTHLLQVVNRCREHRQPPQRRDRRGQVALGIVELPDVTVSNVRGRAL